MSEELKRQLVETVVSHVKLREEEFVAPVVKRSAGLFELLVAIILTQNTSDKNAFKAYYNLKGRLGIIEPQSILSLSEEELSQLIRPAGMHRGRARKLIELSRRLLGHPLEEISRMSFEEARKFLMDLPGVGEKTADVLLLNMGKPAFPVDTHIKRIAARWSIGKSYREISEWFRKNFPPTRYLEIHLKLIQFGRDYCRAQRPRCDVCPVRHMCPWPGAGGRKKA